MIYVFEADHYRKLSNLYQKFSLSFNPCLENPAGVNIILKNGFVWILVFAL